MTRHSLAVVLLLLLAGCKEPPPPAPPEPIRPVKVMEVRPQPDRIAFVLPGEVKARWETPLAFRVGGKVIRRSVEIGQVVKPGDEIALLDDSDLRLVVNAQQAALAAAQADAKLARSEEARARQMFDKKLAPQSQLDQALGAREAAEAQARAAEAQLEQMRHQAGYARLVADEAGVVTAVAAEAGQVVAAGQTIVKIARPGEKEIALAVPEARLPLVASAEALEITLNAAPGRTWQGRLRELAPAADPATRTFAARVTILDAGDAVALGMSAQVRFAKSNGEALVVPLTALSSKDDQPKVWRLDRTSNRVRRVEVKLGPTRGDGVIVTAGIAAGDWLVTAGAHLLREGLEVRPMVEGAR